VNLINQDFVYAIIPHFGHAQVGQPNILAPDSAGISLLDRAIQAAENYPDESRVDLVIVLSPDEDVLDAASDQGAIVHEVAVGLQPFQAAHDYFNAADVLIADDQDPKMVFIDPVDLKISNLISVKSLLTK
jgi:CMP-N-acetylneuraminic acid synthetase